MITGVDYSGGGPLTVAQCRGGGISFVCRYVSSTATAWNVAKTVRQSEVDAFKAGGIGIVIVFESDPKDAFGGHAQGVVNAYTAEALVKARGLAGCPIYFAIDFDAVPSQYAMVDAYIDGAANVIGADRIGAYGSHRVITHLFDGGRIRYGWASPAWGGSLDPRAHLFQYGGGTVAGVSVDWNRTVSSDVDYGQYRPAVPVTPPVPVPTYIERLLMAKAVIVFFQYPEGSVNEANLLTGTWRHMWTPEEYTMRRGVLDYYGVPYGDEGFVSVPAKFGRRDDQGLTADTPIWSRGDKVNYPFGPFTSGIDEKEANTGAAVVAAANQAVVDAKQAAVDAAKNAAAVADLAAQLADIIATLAAQDAATEAAAEAGPVTDG